MEEKQREYYGRIVRLKPVIESESRIMKRMENIFHHVYANESLDEDISNLGEGCSHKVFGIGRIVDPLNRQDIFLALRVKLYHGWPYQTEAEDLTKMLAMFEQAFIDDNNPPYFVGAVTSKLAYRELLDGSKLAGMITEDLSAGKKYKIVNCEDEDYCERIHEGMRERFFIDPNWINYIYLEGSHYLQQEACINLP